MTRQYLSIHITMQQVEYVIFSSSGSHGFLFEGVLQALEDHLPNYDGWLRSLKGVAGTSGGSLTALIVALSIKRRDRHDILGCLADMTNLVRYPNISVMVNRYGIDDGESFRRIIQDILTRGGLSESSTMSDLRRLLRMDVVFVAHDMLRGTPKHLTAETTPDMLVSDAVFASCCIPLLFAPYVSGDTILCDGALSEYMPKVFPAHMTLNVVIPPTYTFAQMDSWYGFLRSLILAYIVPQREYIDTVLAHNNTIAATHPFMHTVNAIEARMSTEMLAKVKHCGYISGMQFLYPQLVEVVYNMTRMYMNLTYGLTTTSPGFESENEDDQCDSK